MNNNFLSSCLIEPAKDTHSEPILALIKDSISSHHGAFSPDLNAHAELQYPATSAHARGGIALVASFDQRIIGFAFMHKSLESFVIDHLYISHAHQKRGLGSKLLIDTIAFALQQSQSEQTCIELWIESHLTQIVDFFQHFGFVKNGDSRRRIKKLPHLHENERDFSTIEICLLLLLAHNNNP